jgi:hypothetical protein
LAELPGKRLPRIAPALAEANIRTASDLTKANRS